MSRFIFQYTEAHPRHTKPKRGWDNLNSRNFDPWSYVEAGRDINATDHAGNTILCWASLAAGTPEGDEFIRAVLARNPDVNKCGPNCTPPAISLIYAPQDILNDLDRLGIDWNATNSRGLTALWAVAAEAQVDRVRYLLTRGADPNVMTFDGAPLHAIADEGVGDHPVHNVRTCVQELVQAGADIEAQDTDGNTPLMLAVQRYVQEAGEFGDDLYRHASVIEIFLDAGANPDCRALRRKSALMPNGGTPLTCQCYGKGRVHRALLKAGADPLATCNNGRTAIDYARLALKRKKPHAEPGTLERLLTRMERAARA